MAKAEAVSDAETWQLRGHHAGWAPVRVCGPLDLCVFSVTAGNPLSHPGTQSVPLSQPLTSPVGACGCDYGGQPTDKTGCLSPILIPNHSRDNASCPWCTHTHLWPQRGPLTANFHLPTEIPGLKQEPIVWGDKLRLIETRHRSPITRWQHAHWKLLINKKVSLTEWFMFIWYQGTELLETTSN